MMRRITPGDPPQRLHRSATALNAALMCAGAVANLLAGYVAARTEKSEVLNGCLPHTNDESREWSTGC